jgi:CrcB protein
MKQFSLLALFSILGVSLRWVIVTLIPFQFAMISGVLIVNVIGSFLIGILIQITANSEIISPEMKTALVVGFLGSLTTYSSFASEIFRFLNERMILSGVLYFINHSLITLVSLFIGYYLSAFFFSRLF